MREIDRLLAEEGAGAREALNGTAEPDYIETSLAGLRGLAAGAKVTGKIAAFLEETKDLPGNLVVVVTPGSARLVVDDQGVALAWD